MMILLTRASDQAQSPLTEALDANNIPWINLPCLRIDPPSDPMTTEQVLRQFNTATHVIVTSPNAARLGLSSDQFDKNRSIIAIGPGTQHALTKLGYTHITLPKDSSSEGLLDMTLFAQPVEQDILIVTGESPRPLLADTLKQRGAIVTQAFAYKRTPLNYDDAQLQSLITQPITHVLTMSQETLAALWDICRGHHDWLQSLTLCVTANRQAEAAKAYHFNQLKLLPTPVIEHFIRYLLSLK